MKPLLMFRDRDFDAKQPLCWNEQALTQDLELDTLFGAMAMGDEFLQGIARSAMLSAQLLDVDTILYRQAVLDDCIENEAIVRAVYDLAVETLEKRRRSYLGVLARYPGSVLSTSVQLLELLTEMLVKLRAIADEHATSFRSEGFTALFALLQRELTDEYFERIETHLRDLRFKYGTLVSAGLGEGNEAQNYVLRQPPRKHPSWIKRVLGQAPLSYTFYIDERDHNGAKFLSDIRDRGINLVANAVAQSADHVVGFFSGLRAELAFYVGCLNLRQRLMAQGERLCFPRPEALGGGSRHFDDLYDACLSLKLGRKIVGNTVEADGKRLVIITGANQGGKSTFLRSVGLAQLMMQCGMFVPATRFTGALYRSILTHYKREEDEAMKSGKFDEELSRMNDLVGHVGRDTLLLFNESFAATNEREGSEIADQITRALLEAGARVYYVTHLYGFARRFFERNREDALFLRAERAIDGTRTFRVIVGEPLETSYGEDLYRGIFLAETSEAERGPSTLDAQPEPFR